MFVLESYATSERQRRGTDEMDADVKTKQTRGRAEGRDDAEQRRAEQKRAEAEKNRGRDENRQSSVR